jgi:hypothetical protein
MFFRRFPFAAQITRLFAPSERLVCYHCDERYRKSKNVDVVFQGARRQVCCHGCAAVLQTIEQQGLVQDYLQTKQSNHVIAPAPTIYPTAVD